MVSAVFNPSTESVAHAKLAVPHANFSVEIYNETSRKFESTKATVLCDISNLNETECWLYAKVWIGG